MDVARNRDDGSRRGALRLLLKGNSTFCANMCVGER